MIGPRNHSPRDFLNLAGEIKISEQNARRLLGAVIGKGEFEPLKLVASGIIKKDRIEHFTNLPRLHLKSRLISEIDGFQKLVFTTHDNLSIETVLIPLHRADSISICVSSQVGCVMGCTFCATARMSKRRNLETWEIVDQLIQARAILHKSGRQIRSVVFMGMGEPFLNYRRVLAAAELFCYPVLNAIDAKAITISTVGLVPEIRQFTAEKRAFRLSISLGAATNEKRARLVPIAAKTPLSEVMNAARDHSIATNKRIMLSYVCISNQSIFEEDAKALGKLIGDTPVRLDLIEVTDSTGRYGRPNKEEMRIFRDALTHYVGQPIVRRYSGGSDINAACGTLAGELTI